MNLRSVLGRDHGIRRDSLFIALRDNISISIDSYMDPAIYHVECHQNDIPNLIQENY